MTQRAGRDTTAGDFETLLGMHGMGAESAAGAEQRVSTNQTTPLHSQPKEPVTPPRWLRSPDPESTDSPEAQGSNGTKETPPGSIALAKQKMESMYRGNWVPKVRVPGWQRLVGGSSPGPLPAQGPAAVRQTGQ